MSANRLKNEAEKLSGKAKETAGKLSGKAVTRDRGKAKQAKADLKNAGQSVKKAAKR